MEIEASIGAGEEVMPMVHSCDITKAEVTVTF